MTKSSQGSTKVNALYDPEQPSTCSAKEIVHAQFSKTSLCRFYAQGRCKMGLYCNFAHREEDIRKVPDLTKTSLCQAFMQNRCKNAASECLFAHGLKDLRTTPMFQAQRYGAKTVQCDPSGESTEGSVFVPQRCPSGFQAERDYSSSDEDHAPMCYPDVTHSVRFSKTDNEDQRSATKNTKKKSKRRQKGNNTKSLKHAETEVPPGIVEIAEKDWSSTKRFPIPVQFVANGQFFFPPSAMEALEQVLKNAMPDHYED